jgi:hypothetical protein
LIEQAVGDRLADRDPQAVWEGAIKVLAHMLQPVQPKGQCEQGDQRGSRPEHSALAGWANYSRTPFGLTTFAH